jgi:hypothetical protein
MYKIITQLQKINMATLSNPTFQVDPLTGVAYGYLGNAIVPRKKMKEVQDEKLFQELDDKVAARSTTQFAYLYKDDNFQGESLRYVDGSVSLHTWGFDDQISSIRIEGNEQWAFYPESWFRGNPVILGSGNYTLTQLEQLGIPNNSITSLRRVGGSLWG